MNVKQLRELIKDPKILCRCGHVKDSEDDVSCSACKKRDEKLVERLAEFKLWCDQNHDPSDDKDDDDDDGEE